MAERQNTSPSSSASAAKSPSSPSTSAAGSVRAAARTKSFDDGSSLFALRSAATEKIGNAPRQGGDPGAAKKEDARPLGFEFTKEFSKTIDTEWGPLVLDKVKLAVSMLSSGEALLTFGNEEVKTGKAKVGQTNVSGSAGEQGGSLQAEWDAVFTKFGADLKVKNPVLADDGADGGKVTFTVSCDGFKLKQLEFAGFTKDVGLKFKLFEISGEGLSGPSVTLEEGLKFAGPEGVDIKAKLSLAFKPNWKFLVERFGTPLMIRFIQPLALYLESLLASSLGELLLPILVTIGNIYLVFDADAHGDNIRNAGLSAGLQVRNACEAFAGIMIGRAGGGGSGAARGAADAERTLTELLTYHQRQRPDITRPALIAALSRTHGEREFYDHYFEAARKNGLEQVKALARNSSEWRTLETYIDLAAWGHRHQLDSFPDARAQIARVTGA